MTTTAKCDSPAELAAIAKLPVGKAWHGKEVRVDDQGWKQYHYLLDGTRVRIVRLEKSGGMITGRQTVIRLDEHTGYYYPSHFEKFL